MLVAALLLARPGRSWQSLPSRCEHLRAVSSSGMHGEGRPSPACGCQLSLYRSRRAGSKHWVTLHCHHPVEAERMC